MEDFKNWLTTEQTSSGKAKKTTTNNRAIPVTIAYCEFGTASGLQFRMQAFSGDTEGKTAAKRWLEIQSEYRKLLFQAVGTRDIKLTGLPHGVERYKADE